MQRFFCRTVCICNRISDTNILYRFDRTANPAYLSTFQYIFFYFLWISDSNFQYFIFCIACHKTHFITNTNTSFLYADISNDSSIWVI